MVYNPSDLISEHSLKSYLERQPTQTLNMLLQTCKEDEWDIGLMTLILQILLEREENSYPQAIPD